jgi:hypothetical protein
VRVDAVESVAHVAAAAERVVAANGACGRVRVLHKDARHLTVGRQPDGRPGDLDVGADVVVFEVREKVSGVPPFDAPFLSLSAPERKRGRMGATMSGDGSASSTESRARTCARARERRKTHLFFE